MADLSIEPHIVARLSIQRALLTHVTPTLRSVSLAISSDQRELSIQFVFDDARTKDELELPSIVSAEVAGDWAYPDLVNESVLTVPAPKQIPHLEWVVYQRCEDEWITDD